MTLAFLAARQRDFSKFREISSKPWFYPVALFLVGFLSYGYVLPSLGFYWDDWEVVFLLHNHNLPLFYSYFAFDRPFAWSYPAMYAVFGMNPAAWHVITLLLRWAGILFLYYSFVNLWPSFRSYLRWLGVLLIVYPGFFQQSISVAYNRHFTSFFLFALSFYLMVLAVRQPKQKWRWILFILSWLAAFVQVYTIEYFIGLELIRPLMIWLLLAERGQTRMRPRLAKTAIFSAPYLLILGSFLWWRLIVFPTMMSPLDYVRGFQLLADFQASFLDGLLTLLTRGFSDLLYSTLQVWLGGVTGSNFTFVGKATWFAFGLAIVITAVFAFFQDVARRTEEPRQHRPIVMFLFGFCVFLVSGLPIWLTSKQLSGGGRWDDRFSMAMMLGAGLMFIALVMWLIRARRQKLVLSVALVFSIAAQVMVVNKYRLDWAVQRDYYWQLAWRIPALQAGTTIFSIGLPSESVPSYDANFALNALFDGKVDTSMDSGVLKGTTTYGLFTDNIPSGPALTSSTPVSRTHRNITINGNTSDAITVVHQGANRCLQVLDTIYTGEPSYAVGQDELTGISKVSRILTTAKAKTPDRTIFGPEPAHTWCFYFEKADLARQMQDWQTVLSLYKQAGERGYSPGFGPEYIPFIEAYVRTGNWQKAYELSLAAQKSVKEMEPFLCTVWKKFSKLPSVDMKTVNQSMQAFSCATQ